MRNLIILILVVTNIYQLFSQENVLEVKQKLEYAKINDPDGFTNIREGEGTDSKIIDKLYKDEFFLYNASEKGNWVKIHKMWNVEGFVHKSRIQPLNELSDELQKTLITGIFNKEIELHKKHMNYELKSNEYQNFHEEKFNPILDLLSYFLCKNQDDELINKFLDYIIETPGSADEHPAWIIGKIYICKPNWIIEKTKNKNSSHLNEILEFGFLNVTYQKEKEIENFEYLKQLINDLKKK